MPEMKTVLYTTGRLALGFWRLLDGTRRALLNLLFLGLLVLVAWLLLRGGGPPPLQEKTALVLALDGPVREQFHGSLRDNAINRLKGEPQAETRLRDVLAALDAAAKDPAISRAVLILDNFAGAGLPTLRELAAALERFKAAGKPVVAWGSGYSQRQYYLAAHASEVWLHPMGAVDIQGLGGYRNYYKAALDKLGLQAHVVRAGQFKSLGEVYVADGPSEQTQEAEATLLNGLWASYTGGVEKARRLPAGTLMAAIDGLPERLAAVNGDLAKLALKEKFVDALKTNDQMRASLIEQGARDGKTFRQVHYRAYLGRVKPPSGTQAVAVVVAEGGIRDGEAGPGAVGGASTAAMIRSAREDNAIKALVLRVNSPGGSAFASEVVRRELELTRAAGKPVVVSMGDVAASGGYWISMAADEVIADEATVTGSIGVVAVLPSAEKAMQTLGVSTGGHGTTWLVGAYDLRRGLDPRLQQVIQASIDRTYAEFLGRAAAGRKTTVDAIHAVAQGRVWTGAQAKERALVDRLGGLNDALAAAAKRARLAEGHRVQYIERGPGRAERLLALLGVDAGDLMTALGLDGVLADHAAQQGALATLAGLPLPALQQAQADLATLLAPATGGEGALSAAQPWAALSHCFCGAP
ncbi:MAG: signal peptide peptidase SppA [Rubrivivax sp.]|jgi:protease-4